MTRFAAACPVLCSADEKRPADTLRPRDPMRSIEVEDQSSSGRI